MENTQKQKKQRDIWYDLDNAAKIFPAVSNERNTNVFRLSCELRENIDKVTLKLALDAALKGFEHFRVVMRRGLFWYYLERSDLEPQVEFETERPCRRLFYKQVKELLFRVTYYRRRINLEVFHSVADGNGALGFLHSIVYHYLLLKHPAELSPPPPVDFLPTPVLGHMDSFDHHYDPKNKKNTRSAKAFMIGGTLLPVSFISVICGTVSTKRMLALAKSKGATATAYLTALLICAIYTELTPKRLAHKPIGVTIPVDLRGHFSSVTTRNFFGVVDVRYSFGGKPADFDEVLASVCGQLSEKVNPEKLSQRVNYTMGVQKNIFARFTPLFLKNLVLAAAYHKSERATTTALSNMGRISAPEALTPYIAGFGALLNPTPIHRVKLCVCSFGDDFVMNFTSMIAETSAQKYFFRHLSSNGVDVVITSNGVTDDEIL